MSVITENNYVDEAEKAITALFNQPDKKGRPMVPTTSQIRNLLAMTADIYNEVLNIQSKELPAEVQSRISYLRVRFVYESGRNENVKAFVQRAKLLDILSEIKGDKQKYILFSRYMEALVAFRKFQGGDKDV